MKRSAIRKLWISFLSCCVLISPLSFAQARADRKEIVGQARAAYYSLSNRGLVEFQCNVQPNWRLVLKDVLAADPASAETALRLLNGIHFTVSLGPDGAVKVTHRADVAPTNDKVAEGFNQIFTGMEQAMSGFFDTWKPFMLSTPFPAVESDYRLEESENQYHLSYKEGTADVVTTMGKDFAISETKVTTPEFASSISPQFTRTAEGFLLTGYQATYRGKSDADRTVLQVGIVYQQVNGLQLPQKLNLAGSYGDSPFQIEVTFSGCQAKRR
jgi:hypothetical protein